MKPKLSSQTLLSCALASLLLAGCAQQQQQAQTRDRHMSGSQQQQAPRRERHMGSSQQQQQRQRPAAPAMETAPAPAPAPSVKTTCSDPTMGLIRMTKTMPPEVSLGGEFTAVLHLTAQACAANVVVRDTVPDNASFVRSEPAATANGKQLAWPIGDLEAGESREIKVWLKADQEGTIANCASVSADPRTCASTRVVHPAIELTKNEPKDVNICDPIPVTLVVKNTGSSQLTGVKVSDNLPAGLTSEGRNNLEFNAGTLAPGESKEFKFNAVASTTGNHVNAAQVTSDQGVSAKATASTTVHQAVLTIACKAPDERYMGRPFDVCFTVANSGDAAAAGAMAQLPIPNGLTFRSATAGGQVSGNNVVWDLGSLAANGSQQLCATFVSAVAGNYQFNGTVKGACAKEVASTCQTRVVGVAAILLEKSDDPDPVGLGETTTYTVKITNQGSADDTNIRMVVTIAPELAPVSATGDGTIDGQTVTFPAVPRLAAKDAVTYKIVAKGVKAGDGHTSFKLTSDVLKSAISAEESTHVY